MYQKTGDRFSKTIISKVSSINSVDQITVEFTSTEFSPFELTLFGINWRAKHKKSP